MPVPARAPADPPPSYRAVQNLIVTYAELVDDGDFDVSRHLRPAP
jgi:hypothetical protein